MELDKIGGEGASPVAQVSFISGELEIKFLILYIAARLVETVKSAL